jgi:MFS transporter, DHA3 family, tetracycline resistance protein
MGSRANALGQVAGGPVIGAVGTLAGIRAALAVAAITLSPALLLYARAIRRGAAEPDLEGPNNAGKM